VGLVNTVERASVRAAARAITRELRKQARPAGTFDPSRYFRTTEPLEFLNVCAPVVRRLARDVAREHRHDWSLDDAVRFADLLMHERALELKNAGIDALAVRRREFTPSVLIVAKRWLAHDCAANWATTDTLCGQVISPLLLARPEQVNTVIAWSGHSKLWVRRASAVSLVRLAARGLHVDAAYGVATALRSDTNDLIHKAAGWLLREAGRTDERRLEDYLRQHGGSIPRTTVRYAIERFPAARRLALLEATRPAPPYRTDRSRDRVNHQTR
jgi:3-methyladenine DNA glycosylase AlkD